jgi:hypothetical protein
MKAYILRVTDAYSFDVPTDNEDDVKLAVTNYFKSVGLHNIPFKPIEHYLIMSEKQFVSDKKMAKIMDMPNMFGLEELKKDGNDSHSAN